MHSRYGESTNTYGTGSIRTDGSSAAEAPQTRTALEDHLVVLESHEKNCYALIARVRQIADRLLGPQPSPISKDVAGQDSPTIIPLMTKVDRAGRELTGLLATAHDQLARLERL